ncbi:MAG: hypothetical protein Q7S11_02680 [bacterium]|nr:hypothetical protein [bacterium]
MRVSTPSITAKQTPPLVPQNIVPCIRNRLAQNEDVPLCDLPGITPNDVILLHAIKVTNVKELIFCANKRIVKAFGGRGNTGTMRSIKRVNIALRTHAFPRRMPLKEYKFQIAKLQKVLSLV